MALAPAMSARREESVRGTTVRRELRALTVPIPDIATADVSVAVVSDASLGFDRDSVEPAPLRWVSGMATSFKAAAQYAESPCHHLGRGTCSTSFY